MRKIHRKILLIGNAWGALVLLTPALCLANEANDAGKMAAKIGDSKDLLKNHSSCMESKARFDAAYKDIKEEAEKGQDGCQNAMQTKPDFTCGMQQDSEEKNSCCVRIHHMVTNHIRGIGNQLQNACDDLLKAEEAAAKCQQDGNNQQCASKARAPFLKSAAEKLRAMRQQIKEAQIVEARSKGMAAYALTQMLDRAKGTDGALKKDRLCSPDAEFFRQKPQSLASVFGFGDHAVQCGADGSVVSHNDREIKSKLREIEDYRDSLTPRDDGTTATDQIDPRNKKLGPYVEEEANSVWIAQGAGKVGKSLEPMADSMAKSVEYQAQQAENNSKSLGSIDPEPSVTGPKSAELPPPREGNGPAGNDGTGASKMASYISPGANPPASPPPSAPLVPLLSTSAFAGDLFSASPPPPRQTQSARSAAKASDASPASEVSSITAKENNGTAPVAAALRYLNDPHQSSITVGAKNEAPPATAAAKATDNPEENGGQAARAQKEEAAEAPGTFRAQSEADRSPASKDAARQAAAASPGEEEMLEEPWPADTASPTGRRLLKELSSSERLRDLLRKRLSEKDAGSGTAEGRKLKAMAKYLAKADELAAEREGDSSFPLAQLEDGGGEESLFLRVRGAYLRFQQKGRGRR